MHLLTNFIIVFNKIINYFIGLTSIPAVGFLFYYGNINCPEMALSIISLPRIFTFRFEVTQFTCLGIDRVITTLLTNG